MLARHHCLIPAMAALAGALLWAPHGARAQAPDAERIQAAVLFALQCNATLGSIHGVEITDLREGGPGQLAVRGVYRQAMGGGLSMRMPEAAGGVFEGVWDSAQRKLTQVSYKVSIRAGQVRPECIR
jgi:hypothetical protein